MTKELTTPAIDTLEATKIFHTAFGQGVPNAPCLETNSDNIYLYDGLLSEEHNEFQDAMESADEVEVLDALCDLQVILDGLWIQTGMHMMKEAAMREVFLSNMSKLGEDKLPIVRESDGKIMKGPNYFKPDLAKVLADRKNKS